MRILQINSAQGWGGGEAHTLMLAQGLRARGQTVVLACQPGSAIAERFGAEGFDQYPLPLRGELDLFTAWQLADYQQAHGFDIVHAHLARDYPVAAYATLRAPRMQLVLTRHVLFPLRMWLLNRFVLSRTAAIIAVSESVKSTLIHDSGVPATLISTIYNGIPTAQFATARTGQLRSELSLAGAGVLIGVVGSISPHKGLDTFLRAIPLLTAGHPDAHFVIVGNALHEEYVTELRNLVLQLGIVNCSWLIGQRADIPQIMKDLTILVMPSQGEAFGLVLVEAMAAGTPVVATSVGGVREIITDGENGLLVPPKDPIRLAKALGGLLKQPALMERLRAAGQSDACRRFDLNIMVEQTLQRYEAVIAGIVNSSCVESDS